VVVKSKAVKKSLVVDNITAGSYDFFVNQIKSRYLSEGMKFNAENLKLIQSVTVEIL
jgi:hypothetical protein